MRPSLRPRPLRRVRPPQPGMARATQGREGHADERGQSEARDAPSTRVSRLDPNEVHRNRSFRNQTPDKRVTFPQNFPRGPVRTRPDPSGPARARHPAHHSPDPGTHAPGRSGWPGACTRIPELQQHSKLFLISTEMPTLPLKRTTFATLAGMRLHAAFHCNIPRMFKNRR